MLDIETEADTGKVPCIYAGIPAYNVESEITNVIQETLRTGIIDFILVVDDGSSDQTFQILESLGEQNLVLLQHSENCGYGAAIKTLFNEFSRRACKPEDVLVIVHGDGQTAPNELPKLVAPFSDFSVDVVLGSRMLAGFKEQVGKRALFKIMFDYGLTYIQNIMYDMRVSTFSSGYRAFRRRAVDRLVYGDCANRHAFDIEILIRARNVDLCLKEVPVRTVKSEQTSNNVLVDYAISTIKLMWRYGIRKK